VKEEGKELGKGRANAEKAFDSSWGPPLFVSLEMPIKVVIAGGIPGDVSERRLFKSDEKPGGNTEKL